MKTQKNYSAYATTLVAFLSWIFIGCEKDFPNPNAPLLEQTSVQTLVTGAEAGLRVDHAIYLRVVGTFGREAYYFEPADPRYTGELVRGTPDPGGFLLNRPWAAHHRVIATCNWAIEKAQPLSAPERAGVEGFAKTIMAYQHLLNLNYTWGNGIQLDNSGNRTTAFVDTTTALNYMETLLNDAYTALGNAGSSFPFKLTSGFEGEGGVSFNTPSGFRRFNRAIAARVLAYNRKYSAVLTALDSSFLSTTASMKLGVYMVYGTVSGDQRNEVYEDPTASFVRWVAHTSFQANAESGDTRFSSQVRVRPDTISFDDPQLRSWLGVTITSNDVDKLPIIRNEELILLRAEARIATGDLPGAQGDINIVRAAAGLGTVTLLAGNAWDRLLTERRYSLFLEGHRWVDVRRIGGRAGLDQLPNDRAGDFVLTQMPKPENE